MRPLLRVTVVAALATLAIGAPAAGAVTITTEGRTAQVANLTTHPSGLPTATAAPSQQLVSATLTRDTATEVITGSLTLAAAPDASTSLPIVVASGFVTGNGTCSGDVLTTFPSFGSGPDGVTRSGASIAFSIPKSAFTRPFGCAFVGVGGENLQDARLGTSVDGTVKLRATAPDIASTKLGATTPLKVSLQNTGDTAATNVTVRVAGAGVSLSPATVTLSSLAPGATQVVVVRARVTSKEERELRWQIDASGLDDESFTTRLQPAYPRARFVPGAYRGVTKQKFVATFRITPTGRVVGWKSKVSLRCGGYVDQLPYTLVNLLTFTTAKITSAGRVDATFAKTTAPKYRTSLRMTIDGTTVRDGYFSYGGPDQCHGVASFTAKRTGN